MRLAANMTLSISSLSGTHLGSNRADPVQHAQNDIKSYVDQYDMLVQLATAGSVVVSLRPCLRLRLTLIKVTVRMCKQWQLALSCISCCPASVAP